MFCLADRRNLGMVGIQLIQAQLACIAQALPVLIREVR